MHTPHKADVNTLFLGMLPVIVQQARHALRGLSSDRREDALAEVVANCFVAFTRLVELGKADLAYPTVLARFAVKQYFVGRRVGAKTNSAEVYSRAEQGKDGVALRHIGTPGQQRGGWKETLVESHRTTPADLAAFRIDSSAWFGSLPPLKRGIAEDLAVGERTKDVARKNGMSPARVSQLRRELKASWHEFVGDDARAAV